MQNKSFIYRVVPGRTKQNKITVNKKTNGSQLCMKPVKFFENCHIFSEPSIYSRSLTKQNKQKEKQPTVNTFKKAKHNKNSLSPQVFQRSQVPQIARYNKISLQLKSYQSNLYAIHSRRKPISFDRFFSEKCPHSIQKSDDRLEINAFNCQKLAKRVSFIKRDIYTEKHERKMNHSKIQKILSLYPQQNIKIDKNLQFCSKKGSTIDVGFERRGRMYRPWSPEKANGSDLIEITQDLQDFLRIVH